MGILNFKKQGAMAVKNDGNNTSKKHTIMIVDDEVNQLSSLSSLLSGEYNVITAPGGIEALQYIQQMERPQDISLIISDLKMPGLTGVQFFEKVIPIIPKTIRIMLTAYTDPPAFMDSINKAKVYELLKKSFDPEGFLRSIRKAIQSAEQQKQKDGENQLLKQENKNLKNTVEELTKKLEEKEKDLTRIYDLTDRIAGRKEEQAHE